jgi:hypothetical protein
MPPRSGWWQCASEQGSRLVCWLASLVQPDRIKPVERTIEYRRDLTFDLEPYTVAVIAIAAR